MAPTDWTSGERVFAPPQGTLDVDWLIPVLLEQLADSDAVRAREALEQAWRYRAGRSRVASTDPVERTALRIVDAAIADFNVQIPGGPPSVRYGCGEVETDT